MHSRGGRGHRNGTEPPWSGRGTPGAHWLPGCYAGHIPYRAALCALLCKIETRIMSSLQAFKNELTEGKRSVPALVSGKLPVSISCCHYCIISFLPQISIEPPLWQKQKRGRCMTPGRHVNNKVCARGPCWKRQLEKNLRGEGAHQGCVYSPGGRHKAQGPNLALHPVLSGLAPGFYPVAAPSSLPLVKE